MYSFLTKLAQTVEPAPDFNRNILNILSAIRRKKMEKNAWGISIPLRLPQLGPVLENVDKVVQNVGKLSHMLTRGMLGTALGSGAGLLYSGVASDEDSSFWKPVLIGALLGGILGTASGYFMP